MTNPGADVSGALSPSGSAAPAPAATTVQLTSSGSGAVGGFGFAEGSTLMSDSDSDLNRRLDGITSLGAQWIRVDVDWSVVEQTQGQRNWSIPDRVVNAAAARGLNVLAMIGYTPAWARPAGTTDKYGPTDPTQFTAFVDAAAHRYAGKIKAYEIWNEVNMRMFWQPAPSPTAYTRILKGAYTAIKTVDPNATVVTAGFSPAPDSADGSTLAPVTFLQGIYAAGGQGYFDAVGHHPSNYPYSPMRPETIYNYNAFAGVTPVLHDTMAAHGDGAKRIWGTEMGAPVPYVVNGVQTSPGYLATYLTEAAAQWRQWPWTGPLLWYSYRDGGTNASNIEDMFGLVTRDFVPKEPAYSAMRVAMAG